MGGALLAVPTEELEQLHQQMEEEFQAEEFCGIDYYLTVWGRKSK